MTTTSLRETIAAIPDLLAARTVEARRSIDVACWELAARGESAAALGAWACREPAGARELVLGSRDGDLCARARGVRALAVMADGISDEANLPIASQLADVAATWLEHPDPIVWTIAARALGRLAPNVAAAHRTLVAWSAADGAAWRRRRIAAALAAVPRHHAGGWIVDELDRILADETDSWRTAALGVAAAHLSREHPDHWQRLLERAPDGPFEIAWSVAQGLAILGRRGGERGLAASERETLAALRDRAAQMAHRSTDDATRAYDCAAQLARASGGAAPADLAYDMFDDAIRARFTAGPGLRSGPPPNPLALFRDALTTIDEVSEAARGRAHAVMRSATRAHATRIGELVDAPTGSIGAAMAAAIESQLAREVCEYGLRATLISCAGDLVDGAADHGRAAASALRAVARSRWAIDEVANAPDPKARTKAVRRFKKPLEDLFDRCVGRRAPVEKTIPGPLAAWWTLCGGGAELVAELERDADVAGSARDLERALLDAAQGVSPDRWSADLHAALEALDAGDTLLARAFAELAGALDELSVASEVDSIARGFDELVSAIATYLAVASDLDTASLVEHIVLDDLARALARDRRERHQIAPIERRQVDDRRAARRTIPPRDAVAQWEQELPPMIAAIVLPLAKRAAELLATPAPIRRAPGVRIAEFELVERLGGGGAGEVWKARRGRQLVALKLPLPDFAESLAVEARRLEGMYVAKVATFIDAGVNRGTPYLATSYLRGRTLHEHSLEPGSPLDPALARRIARDACTGLANLHELGIVHRDVTPRNIFLRMRGADPTPIPTLAEDPLGKRIDEAVLIDLAALHFSVGYSAPEVVGGGAVGPAADVYGLGATLFHVLTGHRFAHGLVASRAAAWHATVDPFDDAGVRLAASRLPNALAELLASATRLDPDRRLTLEQFDVGLA